jgi:hypothetical protein
MRFRVGQRVRLVRRHKFGGLIGIPEVYLGQVGVIVRYLAHSTKDYLIRFDRSPEFFIHGSMIDLLCPTLDDIFAEIRHIVSEHRAGSAHTQVNI